MKEYKEDQEKQAGIAKTLTDLLSETKSHQKQVRAQFEEKEGLKAKFIRILDHYALQREALNAITQGRLIKELKDNAQSQVNNL
jgi:hypothetical protein